MLRLSLPFLALLSVALGLLTLLKVPEWLNWKVAVLVGEYGFWMALVPVAVGSAGWLCRREHRFVAMAVVTASAVAVALLLAPCIQAWTIGRTLPATLANRLGPEELRRPPFSVARLFRGQPTGAPPETLAYSGDLKLDFYRPSRRAMAPGVIVVHGGGWDDGDRGQIPQFNHWLASLGYGVADISYRLAPRFRWPAQRDDLRAAVTYLRANAPALGLDPTRLVLFGRSAGGQLVEATAYVAPLPGVRGVVAFYAPADLNFAWACGREDDALNSPRLLRQFLGGPPDAVQAAYDSASAILSVGSSTPPTLLVHGGLDTLVWHQQSERLARKLANAGVPCAFLSLPWATHALEYNLNGPSGQLSTYAMEWFLAAVTRAPGKPL